MYTEQNNHLCHYGTLGMKWGHRKDKKRSGRKRTRSEDHMKAATIKKKRVTEMSNEELRTATARMQLENQFYQQAAMNIKNGKHWVGAEMNKIGNTYVTALTKPSSTIAAAKQLIKGKAS